MPIALDDLLKRSTVSTTRGWTNESGIYTPCIEWTGAICDGYGRVNHEKRSYRVHRVRWIIHHGNIPAGLVVCHRCDNRACFRLDHLFLGTRNDNQQDMKHKGRSTKGIKNASSILTDDQVLDILNDKRSARVVGLHYGVSRETIRDIRLGIKWGWLTGIDRD